MSRDVRQATADDVDAIHETARRSWHAAYDEILEARRIDEIVDEWYAISDLESSIANASSRDDVVFLVADGDADAPYRGSRTAALALHTPFRGPKERRLHFWYESTSIPRRGATESDRGYSPHSEKLADRFDRIRLAVLADNHVGVSFYESSGFDRIETRESELSEGLEEYVYQSRCEPLGDGEPPSRTVSIQRETTPTPYATRRTDRFRRTNRYSTDFARFWKSPLPHSLHSPGFVSALTIRPHWRHSYSEEISDVSPSMSWSWGMHPRSCPRCINST